MRISEKNFFFAGIHSEFNLHIILNQVLRVEDLSKAFLIGLKTKNGSDITLSILLFKDTCFVQERFTSYYNNFDEENA